MNVIYTEDETINARLIRLGMIINVMERGHITRDEAKELLSGPLVPGDLSTVHDDSALLDLPREELLRLLIGDKLFREPHDGKNKH